MSIYDIKPNDLCTLQMCRLNSEYYELIKDLLKNNEKTSTINSKMKEISQIILQHENQTFLKTKKENGKIVLDFEKGPISFHSQTGNKTNNIEGPSIFSTKCDCSQSCKGILKYNCVIIEKPIPCNEEMSNFTIMKNTSMIINLSGCESNLDYNLKGIYDEGFKDDVLVKYGNGSRYFGKWKNGMPHGSGILTLTGIKREYYKICGLDVKHIKLLGDFNEGLLDETIRFKLVVVLNNISKRDKFRIIAYENTTLYDKIFIPDKKATITYYNSDIEDPEKCYGIFKGTINKTDRLNGEMCYSNPKAMITYYKGEFKHNQFFKGLCILSKSHSLYSFEGEYNETGPFFGTKKYKNGATYNGYYQNHVEGVLDKTNIHDVTCECCCKVVKPSTNQSSVEMAAFATLEGMWMNDKLVFNHPLSKECSKSKCSNPKSIACLVCHKYYCKECYTRHQNLKGPQRSFRYHDVMKFRHEKESIETRTIETRTIETGLCLDGSDLQISPASQLIPSRIETKPNTLGNYLPESLSLPDSVSLQATHAKKKKKKKKNKKKKQPQTVVKEFDLTDQEQKDLKKGIVNETLANFMNDVAIQGLKDMGFNTTNIRAEDVTYSIEEVIPNEPNTSIIAEKEVVEEPQIQPYDSSFEDFLKEMKKKYNSNLTRKPKKVNSV